MVEVLRAGIHTSFQDRGRYGHRDQGVPLSGAMDRYSAQLANQILGNDADAPLLEFVMQGPKLRFEESKHVALAGGTWEAMIDNERIAENQVYTVSAGAELDIKTVSRGMYGYLAVLGGWQVNKILGSCSFYAGISPGMKLKKGDKLPLMSNYTEREKQHAAVIPESSLLATETIEVEPGPEFAHLPEKDRTALFRGDFSPTRESNRMAYPLNHDLELSTGEIITGPVQPGTVQLTPSGRLIVLMRDAQTTGGYARILQLTPNAINALAQKRPGEVFRFAMRK